MISALHPATRQRNRDLLAISFPLLPNVILSGLAYAAHTRGTRVTRMAAADDGHAAAVLRHRPIREVRSTL